MAGSRTRVPVKFEYDNVDHYYTSLNKCAKCLGISPPTMSRCIKLGFCWGYSIVRIDKIPDDAVHCDVVIEHPPAYIQNMVDLLMYYDTCSNTDDKIKICMEFAKLKKTKQQPS